ncbi:PREDICTED: somatostatin receptor type 2-like [Priapulus caudatus]|uniref:Somatostatin receptor type 2-like n=1 Tax=Priapulus caudatus TaxID=37621 RepID=A0ABM1DQW9_PRICU|nr:PREDICTED: somatostatin receptor type 2-like [Priapulus caudatus]
MADGSSVAPPSCDPPFAANCTPSSSSLSSADDAEMAAAMMAMAISRSVLTIVYSVISVVGLCGNSLVIYVVLRFSKMKTVANVYLVNLAIADEIFLLGIPFVIVTAQMHTWPFGDAMCKVYMTTATVSQFTSSVSLIVMSFDRYMVFCQPLRSLRSRTRKLAVGICSCVWTMAFMMTLPVILYAGVQGDDGQEDVTCVVTWPGHASDTIFLCYTCVVSFAIPVVASLVLYARVMVAMRTRRYAVAMSADVERSERRVTKMVLTVIAVYAFCWLPYWTLQIMIRVSLAPRSYLIYVVCAVFSLSYASSMTNPFLYAFQSQSFRQSFARACRCRAVRRKLNGKLQRHANGHRSLWLSSAIDESRADRLLVADRRASVQYTCDETRVADGLLVADGCATSAPYTCDETRDDADGMLAADDKSGATMQHTCDELRADRLLAADDKCTSASCACNDGVCVVVAANSLQLNVRASADDDDVTSD